MQNEEKPRLFVRRTETYGERKTEVSTKLCADCVSPTPMAEQTTTIAKTRAKKKTIRQVSQGCAYIQATFNNTIVTLTDLNGNTLGWSSAGNCGFKGPKKSTPYAASIVVKTAADRVKETGLKEVNVLVSGVGTGRDSAIRALNANGFQVLSIKDLTPLPHNGCRQPKPRRV